MGEFSPRDKSTPHKFVSHKEVTIKEVIIRSAEKRNTRDYFPKLSGSAFHLAWRVTNDFVRESKTKTKNKNKRKTRKRKKRKEKEAAIEKNVTLFAFKSFGEPLQTIAQT